MGPRLYHRPHRTELARALLLDPLGAHRQPLHDFGELRLDTYGHYRLTVSKGNIGSSDGSAVETKSVFHQYTGALPANHWFLNTPAEECVSYGAPSIGLDVVTACSELPAPFTTRLNWDSSTGFLSGSRVLKSGTTESEDDLLTLFTYDHGN